MAAPGIMIQHKAPPRPRCRSRGDRVLRSGRVAKGDEDHSKKTRAAVEQHAEGLRELVA